MQITKDIIIEGSSEAVQTGIIQDDKFYIETHFNDKKQLDENQNIRISNLIDKAKLDIHEGEDLRGWIRCPDVLQWSMFKKQYPNVYGMLTANTEEMRIKGMHEMKRLFPEWIVYDRL